MKHPDEHILELFVTGSVKIARRRRAIGAHTAHCTACRARVRQMREFYAAVDREAAAGPMRGLDAHTSLVRRSDTLQIYNEPGKPTPVSALPRFGFYTSIRRHPIAAGAGSMFLLATLLWVTNLISGAISRDTKVAYFQYNTVGGTLDVFNKEDQMIWQKPVLRIDEAAALEAKGNFFTQISDIDNDGRNEIITTLSFKSLGDDGKGTKVRLFRSSTDITELGTINREVTFGGQTYQANYDPCGMVVWDDSSTREKEAFVGGVNFRSPYVLAAFDFEGDRLGEYWHYGHLTNIYRLDRLGTAKNDGLVLAGVNDARDSIGISFPAIIVLDPEKMRGLAESSTTRGFGFPPSLAELFYIRLPEPDVLSATRGKSYISRMIENDERGVSFVVTKGFGAAAVEFAFSRDLVARSVKPIDGFETVHERLLKEGKITSTIDKSYFEKLKAEIRYWDGKAWRKELVTVQH